MKTTILFVCTGNTDRSPTAKALCAQYPHLEARSAGTSPYAKNPLTEAMVRAADILVVMERGHEEYIRKHFPKAVAGKPLHCLDIPDQFRSMDPTLVRILLERLQPIARAAVFAQERNNAANETYQYGEPRPRRLLVSRPK